MKIRLMGAEDECRQVAGRLASIVEVLEVSEPFPNRGASRQVRVYIECRAAPQGPVVSWQGTGPGGQPVKVIDAGELPPGEPDA